MFLNFIKHASAKFNRGNMWGISDQTGNESVNRKKIQRSQWPLVEIGSQQKKKKKKWNEIL